MNIISRIFSQKKEKRSSFSWKDPFPWFGGATRSGVAITSETAIGISSLWRAVDVVSGLIASFPKKVFLKNADGTRREDTRHPVSLLLRRLPLANETLYSFWYTLVARAMLFGGAGALIVRDENGQAINLVPFKGYVVPWIDNEGEWWVYVNNTARAIPYADVIYVPGIMMTNGETGRSIVETFADTFGEIKAAEIFSQKYYANGGTLAGFVSYPEKLTDVQLTARRDMWQRNYGNLDSDNMTAFFDMGGKYQSINNSIKDSEVTTSRTFGINEVSRITGVPLPILGETGKTSYNNIEGMNRHFFDLTILPWCTKIVQELEKKLLQQDFNHYIKINTSALLQADTVKQGQFFNMMLNNGVFSINEVRDLLDLNPVKGGDKHRVQMQDVPIDEQNVSDE